MSFVSPPEAWDSHVEEYAGMVGEGGPLLPQLLSVAQVARPFSTATAILDDGCGTGNVIALLIKNFGAEIPAGARLVASDYSSGMVEYLRKRQVAGENASNPLWQRVETHVLDAGDLSAAIAPASLSHVLSNLVFMGMEDASKPLGAAYRALEDGGILAFTVWTEMGLFKAWKHAKELVPYVEQHLDVPEGWRSEAEVRKALEDAGFEVVAAEARIQPQKHTPESFYQLTRMFIESHNPMATAVFKGFTKDQLDQAARLITDGLVKEQGTESLVVNGGHLTIAILGPFLPSVTRLYIWYWNVIKNGYFYRKIEIIQANYGPVVRIAPNEIHLADPDNYDKAYKIGNYEKPSRP
ncbi:S-adenosyl-L-methionine-dependent methyltransferase [Thozetella sp. PMI_491]|nr:S-adenosyl-L-methionine-dependent methyltransferase [Thozetella sp. PMI_491]